MGYIFVSYSRKQMYFAEAVALNLQQSGLEVWFDLQKLTPGVDWSSALKEGYSHCDRLILIASQAALQSPYVQVEWVTALQNGREVILVLSEAVILPEALRNCAVYDARTHFDRTIRSLVTYLRGERPARHDAVPAPGKASYPLSMPFDIWLTLVVLFLPTLTVWTAALTLPSNIIDFNINLDFITRLMPGLAVQEILFYLAGLLAGLYLALQYFPIRAFWKHDTGYEELEKARWNVLAIQAIPAIIVLVVLTLYPEGRPVNPVGYLVIPSLLISAYWAFWVLPRSPDILRWLPSGQADQEVRESLQPELSPEIARSKAQENTSPAPDAAKFVIHHHPADAYNARFIESVLRSEGCRPSRDHEARTHLVVVSNRTSKQWLLDLDDTLPGQLIHILTTNINTPPELQPVLQTQWVDFRLGRVKTLQALAAHLTGRDRADIGYGLQISPTGFDTEDGFPRHIGYILGSFYLPAFILVPVLAMLPFQITDALVFALCALFGLPLVLYVDALVMRRAALPRLVQERLGHRAAWFASSAPATPDSIGNADRKYLYKLTSWTNPRVK